jgi:tetratricopeptide (TPR) repeat protein
MKQDFLEQGIAQAKKGEYAAAIMAFNQAIAYGNTERIALEPQAAEVYYRRGLAYYDLGEIDKAIADYNQSLNLNAQQVKVYLARAIAFLAVNNIQSSIIDLQIIFSLDLKCDQAYKLRANICLRLKEYDQAIDYLKQAGKIYLERQDKESCRYCLARIRQIEQQKIESQGGVTNQAFLKQIEQKISQGKLAEAVRDCNWLLKLDPYDARAYQYRGNISVELGEYKQARQDLRKAAQYFRTQGNLAESEKLERCCLELQLNHVYEQITTKQTNLPELIRTSQPQNALQNRLYTLVGNWNIAQSLVERLMQRYPDQPDIWYWEKAIDDIERDS